MKKEINANELSGRWGYPTDEHELYKKNQALMQKWEESLTTPYAKKNFCSDGFYPYYTHQKVKVLFIGQESYWLNGCDYIHTFIDTYRKESINKMVFHRRLFYVAYGILNNFPAWKDVPYPNSIKDRILCKNGLSFAFMNISKTSYPDGYRHTNWGELMESVRAGSAFIREEVKLLAPDIVITMSLMGNNEIKEALFDSCELLDASSNNVHVYRGVNGGKQMLVLDTWHFSALKSQCACYYEPIKSAMWQYYFGQAAEKQTVSVAPTAPSVNAKQQFISELAEKCYAENATMTAKELARRMNEKGFVTNNGAPYSGGRGTYHLIQSAYWSYERLGEHEKAKNIAERFVNDHGNVVW